VFWLPQHKAIVIGDAFQDGNVPPFELATEDPDAAYARLRALLDLPFELVCPTHGDITDRAAFEASVAG
jgi:glyoxylase-like metal-dependent hydrolase (beta-lactamase superfamily II)